jgi:hypothetical protein
MVVLLLPHSAGQPSFAPDAIRRLAELGVTHLALVRDEETVGLVLEGWAFDPDQSADAVLDVLAGGTQAAKTLRPLTQMAVSAGRSKDGVR